jgi:hypothetical protein
MKKGCGMEMEPPSWRWAVSYTTAITRENLPVKLGIMLLQIMAGSLVLLGNDEEVVDARYLWRDEVIHQGDDVRFSCHDVIVGEMLDQCEHRGALMPLWGVRSKSSQSLVAAPVAGNERLTN